jgi:hypothetical protein
VSQQGGLRERHQRSQTVLRYLAFHLHQHLRQTLFLFKQAPFQFQKKVTQGIEVGWRYGMGQLLLPQIVGLRLLQDLRQGLISLNHRLITHILLGQVRQELFLYALDLIMAQVFI